MNPADAVPLALLLLFGLAVALGGAIVLLAWHWHRQLATSLSIASAPHHDRATPEASQFHPAARRPVAWLTIRNRNSGKVLAALSLTDPKPCCWNCDFASENGLLIAPPVRGWVLVTGNAVPDPAVDVDACFRFLRELSRKLGEVQFFCADHVLHHHGWARLEAGRVIRAYAWAGTTLWHQGVKTATERALDLKTFGYDQEAPSHRWDGSDIIAANVEKVAQLAALWSLDPAEVARRMPRHARAYSGRPSARF